MKLPVIQYRVTVAGQPVATFSNEPAAVKVSGDLAQLIAAAGGTAAGTIGFGTVKVVVDSDLDGIPGTLDTAAMAEAFNREEVAKAEAQRVADAQPVGEIDP